MKCKSLVTVAMICLLAAFASVSIGMASEESATDQSALSGADEVTTVDELDEVTNVSSSYSTNQSSNESSNESSARNVTVIDLSTLNNGTEIEESPNVTVISYTPSVIEEVGAESVSSGVTDVAALSETLGSEVSESAVDLSTLDDGTETEESPNATVIGYTTPSVIEEVGAESVSSEVTGVTALGETLGSEVSESAVDLSTLDNGTKIEESSNTTVISYTTSSVIEEVGAESVSAGVTDVKALSETLGYEVSESAVDLSTLDNGTESEESPNTTVISYTVSSSNESAEEEPVDVRVLGNVLGTTSTTSNVRDLSTLGGESVADNETETTYTSLSSTNKSEVTDVQELSEILGYSADTES